MVLVLSEIKSLSSSDKCLWLQTPTGIALLTDWTEQGMSYKDMADNLGITYSVFYSWRKSYPAIGKAVYRAKPIPKEDLSRPPAYRLVFAYRYSNQEIIVEYDTIEELWEDESIKRYFASHDASEKDYLAACKQSIATKGYYRLSNIYMVIYGEVLKSGSIPIRTPPREGVSIYD